MLFRMIRSRCETVRIRFSINDIFLGYERTLMIIDRPIVRCPCPVLEPAMATGHWSCLSSMLKFV